MFDLTKFVRDFADAMHTVDARGPQAVNTRTKQGYQPGIGPHPESATVDLVVRELSMAHPERYADEIATSIPYPNAKRQRCDLCIGRPGDWECAIEVKMLRFLGDNGKVNDNILMHILSPYPAHRSALTDCLKLKEAAFAPRNGILIYGYDHEAWPLDPAIDAFELLANSVTTMSKRVVANFDDLIHPVHQRGRVFGWEIL